MILEPLDPATVLYVLSMTQPRWAAKARVVAFVGSFHGGAWLSARDVSRAVGRNYRRCGQLLNELEVERVLLRRLASGTRPAWCEVNPDVAAWRDVAWSHDPDTIEARLALHEKHLRASGTALDRLVSRPIGVTQGELAARLIAARLAPGDGALRPLNGTRAYVVNGGASRARIGRASGDPLSRGHDRASSEGVSPTAVPSGSRDHLRVVDGGDASGEPTAGETVTVDERALTAARRAVLQRTVPDGRGRHFVNGRPLVELTALVVEHPLELVLETIERGPAGELVPGFMAWLVDNIGSAPDELVAIGVDHAGRADWLRRRIGNLRAMAPATADDPESESERVSELTECETELAGVLAQLTTEAQAQ